VSTLLNSPLQLPLNGSVLIEASAGTGKTFTIAALYVRFILAHLPRLTAAASRVQPLLPADILVVTFTKAATAELKDRIRKRLVEAAMSFRDASGSQDPFLNALKAEFSPSLWPECAYALQMASEAMDEASVKTIHSWCQSVLREHAFNSGSLFNQQLITDLAPYKLEAVRDYWRNFFYPLDAENFTLVNQLVASPEHVLAQINGLWDLAIPNSTPLQFSAMLKAARQAREQQLAEQHQRWQVLLPRYFAVIEQADNHNWFSKPRTHNAKKAQKDFAPLQAWVALPESQAILQLPELKDAFLKNYGEEFLEHYTGPALTDELPQALLALAHCLEQPIALAPDLLAHAVAWCKARVEQQLARDAVLGFNDIIQHTCRALTNEQGQTLAAILRQQYPVALIDEFQDTDPDQYRIFDAIYQLSANLPEQAVFLIGDPKQAIYAFRGADIFTYLQARRDTSPRHYTLGMNFRSSHALVKGANAFFLPAEHEQSAKAFLFNRAQDNDVPFVAVSAKGVAERLVLDQQKITQAMQVWTALPSDIDVNADADKALSKSAYRQAMAATFSDYIATLLNDAVAGKTGFIADEAPDAPLRPLLSKDIAILVSTHNEGHLMQRELRKRGLASVYLSDRNSVFDTEVARDLLVVITACAEPANKKALLNALYTPLLHVSLAELDALQYDDMQWDNRVGQFYQFANCWQQHGVLAMIRQVMQQFQIAERLLAKPQSTRSSPITGGERYLTDLLHLAELLQQAAAKLDGPLALVRFLHEHLYQTDTMQQPADEQIVRLESDAELIQIVTIHKSKGLEYPLVFLPFISLCRPVSEKDSVFNYHDQQGRPCQRIVADPVILQQADYERLGEDIRKLYVALTRAKYACWLSVVPTGEWQKSALAYLFNAAKASHPRHFISHALQWTAHPLVENMVALTALPQSATPVIYREPLNTISTTTFKARQMPAQHQFQPWWIASYSALKYGAMREPDNALEHNLVDEQEPDDGVMGDSNQTSAPTRELSPDLSLHTLPRGAGPGTFLHNLLQDAAEAGFHNVAEDAQIRAHIMAKRCRHGSWAARREQLDQWLAHYISTPFALPNGGHVTLASLTQYKAEPEFWFAVNGVSTTALDTLVINNVLPGLARPALQPNYLQGMLKGFIDLIFEYQGRYYVVDYKSNYLGADDQAYHYTAMRDKILASRYDMQYVLYTLALHKLLKARLQQDYCYDRHIGGVMYLFLRGQHAHGAGVFTDKPAKHVIEALDDLLSDVERSPLTAEQDHPDE